MAVREVVGSPAALGCTLLGSLAVGSVAAAGWRVAAAARTTGLTANPRFLGGMAELLFLVLAVAVVALAGLVWIPFGAGVAYAVGRGPEKPVSLRATLRAVLDRAEPLARWTKSRVVPGPLVERLLGEDDVAPGEVAVGCEKFVVPALFTDAPELRSAVERANRVTPPAGRERLVGRALATTVSLALVVLIGGFAAGPPLEGAATALAGAVAVVGAAFTAAVDVAWRTETYRSEELKEGFSGTPSAGRDRREG